MDSDRDDSAFTWQGRRELVGQMHDQLDELVAARDQMEQLVRVIVELGSDLDLDVTLHRVLKAAMELTGARYAALGIRAPTAASCPSCTRASTGRRRDGSATSRSAKGCASTI